MTLMNLINAENDQNYISLKEAIELLAKESNSNIWEVATYLLNKNMHISLYSHSKGIDHKIVQNSFLTYQNGGASWIGENDALAWLECIAKSEERFYAPRVIPSFAKYSKGCIETFWERKAFFDDGAIKEALKLSNIPFTRIFLEQEQVSFEGYDLDNCISLEEPEYHFWHEIEQYLNDQDKKNDISQNKVENTKIGCYQNQFDQLEKENEKLKAELAEKEQKIKELESLSCKKDTDLLSLIFDETKKERYSPDLVLSIKLWEHVYIVNPKDDSHSNKADTWLKANTGYDVDKKAGSASKIREITAPFMNWSIHRDKSYTK